MAAENQVRMRNDTAPITRPATRDIGQGRSVEHMLVESALAAALAMLDRGKADEAISCLRPFTPARSLGHVHCNLVGRVLLTAGACDAALAWFDMALAIERRFPDAAANRASALTRLGRWSDADKAFRGAFRVSSTDAAAHVTHASVLVRLGREADALGAYATALKLTPGLVDALRGRAAILARRGDMTGALRDLDAALKTAPESLDLVLDRVNLLHAHDRLGEALAALDNALARTSAAKLSNNRGIVLHDLGRMDEALVSLDEALRLDDGSAQAHHNRGNTLVRLRRYADAVAAFDRAVACDPAHAEAMASRGLALKLLGRFDEAMASFDAALRQDPGCIHARANRGELRLLRGDFESGWADYEYRFFTERQSKPILPKPVPEWDGTPRSGARIVVLADQGNGDTIQFARFLPALRETGMTVTFLCPPRLQRLLRPLTLGIRVVGDVGEVGAAQYQIALSSMPGVFRTSLATLAGSRPYLEAEQPLRERWRDRLGPGGLRIGLCWRGNQAWQCDPNRSVPLSLLEGLGRRPGVRLISLQMPDNAGEEAPASLLEHLGSDFDAGPDAFVDTAAVMATCDLIVTCDTSIAHLAGALGRPTAVLLQAIPEWRWMLDRPTSPWYPTLRLYRQPRPDDWASPIAEIAADLVSGRLTPRSWPDSEQREGQPERDQENDAGLSDDAWPSAMLPGEAAGGAEQA